MMKQPISFWLACSYLIIEYIRPQVIYPSLDVLPWGEVVVGAALISLFLEGRVPQLRTHASAGLLLFSSILLLSSALAYRPDIAFESLNVFLLWVLVYFIITSSVTTPGQIFVFILIFLVASFKLSAHATVSWALDGFAFRDWGVRGPYGWFQNPGELGIQMCVFLPISAAFLWALENRWSWRRRFVLFLMPVTGVITAIATNSRGTIVGMGAIFAWWLLVVSRRFRTFVFVAAILAGGYLLMPQENVERFRAAGEDATSISRIERWADGIKYMNEHPLLGIGYDNWSVYRVENGIGGPGVSHNIFIEAGSELGYSGLIAFLLLIGSTFHLNHRTRKLALSARVENRFWYAMGYGLDGALVGYLASGFFVTVLYYPFFWVNLAMTVALHTATRKRYRVLALRSGTTGKMSHGCVTAATMRNENPLDVTLEMPTHQDN